MDQIKEFDDLTEQVINQSVNDFSVFEDVVYDFPIQKGDKILCKEPYAQELYELYCGDTSEIMNPIKGDIVEGKIVRLTDSYAEIAISGKESAYIELKKEDADYRTHIVEGEKIKVIIKNVNKESTRISFRITASFTDYVNYSKFNEVYESINTQTAYSAVVEELIKDAGYWVSITGVKAFLPGSLAGMNKLVDFDSLLNKTIYVMPINYSKEKNSLVVSHKKYLELSILPAELEELREKPDEHIIGKVTGTTSFGVFAEWGQCLTGMIYKSDLDGDDAAKFLERDIKQGDEIEFKVKDIVNNKKIILTQRYDVIDPWLNVKENYTENTMVEGTVVRIKEYGVFIELEPGLQGLMIIQNKEYLNKYTVGLKKKVKLTKIDKENRKLFFVNSYQKRRQPKT